MFPKLFPVQNLKHHTVLLIYIAVYAFYRTLEVQRFVVLSISKGYIFSNFLLSSVSCVIVMNIIYFRTCNYYAVNLSNLVTYGPQFSDVIKQVGALKRLLCMQMAHLGIF